MIRLIVFDFDGTLVDSNAIKERNLYEVVRHILGGEAAVKKARARGGNRYRIFAEVARRLAPHGKSEAIDAHGKALASAYSLRCARAIVAAPERRGARRALTTLNRLGLRLWVISATPERDLPQLLRRRGILRFFNGFFGGPIDKRKSLRKVMAIERVSPREILVVGDGPDDLDAARSVGAKFVAITAERRVAASGRFAMDDLRNLVPLIFRLASASRTT